ncbi:unnamed protein product [Urochloa humidicola]
MSSLKIRALRRALVDQQNRDEAGRWIPEKKPPSAGKKTVVGKKTTVKKPAVGKKLTEKGKKRKSMTTEKDHMSFRDLHNVVAASQVKIKVFEDELAKEKARKTRGAAAEVKISVLKDELAMERARKDELHRALINVSKKARNI